MKLVRLPEGYVQRAVKIALVNIESITGVELVETDLSFLVNVYVNGYKQYMYAYSTYDDANLMLRLIMSAIKDAE